MNEWLSRALAAGVLPSTVALLSPTHRTFVFKSVWENMADSADGTENGPVLPIKHPQGQITGTSQLPVANCPSHNGLAEACRIT